MTLAGLIQLAPERAALLTSDLGTRAVFLPVPAVGTLSWAAAQDSAALVHS